MAENKLKLAFRTADAWRAWLADNWDKSDGIWMVIYKKDSKVPSVYYDEAVDQALCFGWVDSSIRKHNQQSYLQYFSPRSPKSNWSRVNKQKVEKLIKQDLMAPPGLHLIEVAKQTGTWDALNDVENLVLPPELAKLFSKEKEAAANFERFPRSIKRGILEWIFNAKRPETRQNRIAETARLAQIGIPANTPQAKGK